MEYFRPLKGVDTDLSRLSFSTIMGDSTIEDDFWQYNAIKLAVLHGGLNHLESSSSTRKQRGERVLGAAIKTLIEKYGYSRDEFFITTKQGFLNEDNVEGIPPELLVKEMLSKYPNL